MSSVCKICSHPRRAEIDQAIARRESQRIIANRYSVSQPTVSRHAANCIPEAIECARRQQTIQAAVTAQLPAAQLSIDFNAELQRGFARINKLFDACEEWMQDPDNPEKYTLDARSNEIMVIYDEQRTPDEKPKRKRALLSTLLSRIEAKLGFTAIATERRMADPRELLLKAADRLANQMELLGKSTGLFQQERENETDKEAREQRENETREWILGRIRELAAEMQISVEEARPLYLERVPAARKWVD